MWVTRLLRAPGVALRRFILLSATALVVASSALIGPLSESAFAADAIWNGTDLTYEGNSFTPTTMPPNVTGQPNEYQWQDAAVARVLYLSDSPEQATSATLIEYRLVRGVYTGGSEPQAITVTQDLTAGTEDEEGSTEGASTTCSGNVTGSIGWILCPVSNWIAGGIDAVYDLVAQFFEVQTISGSDTGIRQLWEVVRTIANVAFIIVFLAIIYSQITGAGISNYGIKDMIPRLILGAILVNISFAICALAVDISNLLGYNVQSILMGISEDMAASQDLGGLGELNLSTLTTMILGGGVATYAGWAWLSAAVAASPIAAGFTLLTFLIPAALAVLTAFIVLAVRQALIVVLTAVAPLAFVAYILPGTRDMFNKWRKLFTGLLLMFPVFALVFGASQLAGTAIINSAESAPEGMRVLTVLIGMAVQFVPLAITPLLSKFSTGVLGNIMGMVNNREKGLADRAKNWAQDNADTHKALSLARQSKRHDARVPSRKAKLRAKLQKKVDAGEMTAETADKIADRKANRHGYTRGLALRMDQRKRERDAIKKTSEESLSGMQERDWNRRHDNPVGRRDTEMAGLRQRAHTLQKQAEREKGAFDARADRHWSEFENGGTAEAAHYRDLRTRAAVDKGVAQTIETKLEAQAERASKANIQATMQDVVTDTHFAKKQAEAYEAIVQKAAENSWNTHVRTDATDRNLHLQMTAAAKAADVSEQQLKTFTTEVEVLGSAHTALTTGATGTQAAELQAAADSIKESYLQKDVAANAETSAQREQQVDLAKFYKNDANDEFANEMLRQAGGIGGQAAANIVKARAFQTIVKNQTEGAEAIKTLVTQTDSDELFERIDDPATTVEELMAYAGTIAKRGFHKDHNKLLYRASRMYRAAVESGDTERIGDVKDMIQQINADLSKVSYGVSDYDRTLLAEGRYHSNNYIHTRDRIISNLSPEALSNMDPDDLLMLYEMDRKNLLSPAQHQKIVETYKAWEEDRILGPKLRDKARNVLDRIRDPSIPEDAILFEDNAPPSVNTYKLTEDHFRPDPELPEAYR